MIIRLLEGIGRADFPQTSPHNLAIVVDDLSPGAGRVRHVPVQLAARTFLERLRTSAGPVAMNGAEEAEEVLEGILVGNPLALNEFVKVGGEVHLEQLEKHDVGGRGLRER